MKYLQIFRNSEFGELQILEINGKFEFAATETAKMLGYVNPHDAIHKHCKKEGVAKREVPHPQSINKTIKKNFITEGNLYRLIAHSNLPGAEKFESWVFDEVLPIIRRTGGYIAGEEQMNEDELVLKAMAVLNKKVENLRNKNEQLKLENEKQNQLIGELKPKADYTDKILQSKGTVKVNVIANDYGLTAIAMNKKLHELRIQYKQGKDWLLYREYRGKGYTHSKTIHFTHKDGRPDTNINMEWTQKGRLFLYEILKKNGVIPMIER